MRKSVLGLISLIWITTAFAASSPFDFRCRDVKDLVDLVGDGPDAVIQDLQQGRREFIEDTVEGWKCSTDPFPPSRNGRTYLVGVQCAATDEIKAVTDATLAQAGEIFKRNLSAFYSCFGQQLVNETPKSYTRTSHGEGIIGVLSNSVNGHHLIVEYSYFWDSTVHIPIMWTTKVGYSAAHD